MPNFQEHGKEHPGNQNYPHILPGRQPLNPAMPRRVWCSLQLTLKATRGRTPPKSFTLVVFSPVCGGFHGREKRC